MMIKKLYAGSVLAIAVFGVATSSAAGPDCDSGSAGSNCDDSYYSEVLQCGFLAEHDPEIGAICLENAQANYIGCKNSSACSG